MNAKQAEMPGSQLGQNTRRPSGAPAEPSGAAHAPAHTQHGLHKYWRLNTLLTPDPADSHRAWQPPSKSWKPQPGMPAHSHPVQLPLTPPPHTFPPCPTLFQGPLRLLSSRKPSQDPHGRSQGPNGPPSLTSGGLRCLRRELPRPLSLVCLVPRPDLVQNEYYKETESLCSVGI